LIEEGVKYFWIKKKRGKYMLAVWENVYQVQLPGLVKNSIYLEPTAEVNWGLSVKDEV